MGELRVVGGDDGDDRRRRAAASYASSLRSAAPGKAALHQQGPPRLTPLLDEVLGRGHLVRIEVEASRRTAPHVHDCDQVFVITEGVAIFESPVATVVARPGDVVVVPAGEPHIHTTREDTGTAYVYLTETGHSTDIVDAW